MPTIWEKYPAVVTRLDDELKSGAIFVTCPGIMGDEETELPDPIEPLFDWGWFYVPDIGEEVEIELVVQDDQQEEVFGQAIIDEPRLRWRGKRFRSEAGDQSRPIDPLFTGETFGKRRGFATPEGHVFLFDDTIDKKQAMLAWKKAKDDSDYTQITVDKEGSVLLMTHNSIMLHLNAKDGEQGITALDAEGNMLATSKDGVVLNDKFGNIINLKDGQIQIISVGDLNVLAAKAVVMSSGGSGENVKFELASDGELVVTASKDVKIDCVNAELNATGTYKLHDTADSPLVRWTELNTWLDAHMHPTAFGPSGPPIVPSVGQGIDSEKGTLK